MGYSPIQFHKIWIDQCEATEDIRERFGLDNALHYLIGEKLFSFVQASESDPDFAAELPLFVAEIRRIFSPAEIRDFLDHLEQTKFFAPPEPELDFDNLDDDPDDEPWLEIPSWPLKNYFGSPAFANFCRNSHGEIPKDPTREKRMSDEVIVDAYGPESRRSAGITTSITIGFPFPAKCTAPKTVSPLRRGATVDVRRMAPEDACANDMLVIVRWQNRSLAVPLSQLIDINADEATTEAISDWHFWLALGYSF